MASRGQIAWSVFGVLVIVAVALVLGVLAENPADEVPANVAETGSQLEPSVPLTDQPVAASAGAPEQDDEEGGPDSRAASIDGLIARGHGNPDYRDALIAADSDEEWAALWAETNVIPLTRTKHDASCDVFERTDGENVCWDHYGYHPYLAMSVDELRVIGDSDAAAADALSMLIPRDSPDERMFYAIQASHLSGLAGPLHRYARAMSPSTNDHEGRLEQYALMQLADSQGTPVFLARELEQRLLRDLEITRDELRVEARNVRLQLFQRAKRARWGP